MGSAFSRSRGQRSDEDGGSDRKDKSSKYHFDQNQSDGIFGPHYIMGGMKFETTTPQKFLFGAISDLNYLGPYTLGADLNLPKIDAKNSNGKPSLVKPIEILINLRKSSLRLVRAPSLLPNKDDCEKEQWYHVEFTIDVSVPCTARIHYLIKETPKGNLVPSSNNSTKSDQLEFEAGMNQQFCMLTHRTCPEKILTVDHIANHAESGEGWSWTNIPVVIQLKTKCGRQTQLTYCTFEKNTQSNYVMKIIKQRVRVGRFNFSLQEIYGIEQKADGEELETECSICWDDPRDTLILPCRHLAVCSECAEKIRYQQAACPICRKPFKALLKLEISAKNNPTDESFSEMINNIPNKLLKEEPKDKNDNIQKAVSVEQIKIEDDDPKPNEESNPKQSQDSGLGKTESAEDIVDGNRRPSNISSTADVNDESGESGDSNLPFLNQAET